MNSQLFQTGKDSKIPPRSSIDWHWDQPQGDLKLTMKFKKEFHSHSRSESEKSPVEVPKITTLSASGMENPVVSTMTTSSPSSTASPMGTPREGSESSEQKRTPRAALLPAAVQGIEVSEIPSGTEWESQSMLINFHKLKEQQAKGEKSNEVVDVVVVGEGFTKNLICSVKRTNAVAEDQLEVRRKKPVARRRHLQLY